MCCKGLFFFNVLDFFFSTNRKKSWFSGGENGRGESGRDPTMFKCRSTPVAGQEVNLKIGLEKKTIKNFIINALKHFEIKDLNCLQSSLCF